MGAAAKKLHLLLCLQWNYFAQCGPLQCVHMGGYQTQGLAGVVRPERCCVCCWQHASLGSAQTWVVMKTHFAQRGALQRHDWWGWHTHTAVKQ